jgi:DNA-binding GntR family transcriptional regulator
MSLEDRLDVYVAREAIECGVARRVVEATEPIDFSALEAALDGLRDAVRDQELVTHEIIDDDVEFHRQLVRLIGSPRLERSHETLIAETRMLLRHHPRYELAAYVGDHERLYDALERRDPRAPDLVAEHLRLSARLIGDELARDAREGSAREEESIEEEERTVP